MDHYALDVDSRLNIRRPIRGHASLLMQDGNAVSVQLFDISEGGICVISQLNLGEGLHCLIRASTLLSQASPVRLNQLVEVVYSSYSYRERGFKIGFRFKKIDQALANAIEKYVSALSEQKARFVTA